MAGAAQESQVYLHMDPTSSSAPSSDDSNSSSAEADALFWRKLQDMVGNLTPLVPSANNSPHIPTPSHNLFHPLSLCPPPSPCHAITRWATPLSSPPPPPPTAWTTCASYSRPAKSPPSHHHHHQQQHQQHQQRTSSSRAPTSGESVVTHCCP